MRRLNILFYSFLMLIAFPALNSPVETKEGTPLVVSRGRNLVVYPAPDYQLRRKSDATKNDWKHRVHFQTLNQEADVKQNPIHYSGRASDTMGSTIGGEVEMSFGRDEK